MFLSYFPGSGESLPVDWGLVKAEGSRDRLTSYIASLLLVGNHPSAVITSQQSHRIITEIFRDYYMKYHLIFWTFYDVIEMLASDWSRAVT